MNTDLLQPALPCNASAWNSRLRAQRKSHHRPPIITFWPRRLNRREARRRCAWR